MRKPSSPSATAGNLEERPKVACSLRRAAARAPLEGPPAGSPHSRSLPAQAIQRPEEVPLIINPPFADQSVMSDLHDFTAGGIPADNQQPLSDQTLSTAREVSVIGAEYLTPGAGADRAHV